MAYDDPLPPILTARNMHLLSMGRDNEGKAWLKFGVNRGHVREITVFIVSDNPVTWSYRYAVYEPSTRTIVTYEGKHGDPTKDQRLDIRGA